MPRRRSDGTLARLVGRGRALEILVGGNDLPTAVAADYGYINRVPPDDELDDFVERFARRIASFDRVAVTKIKELIDRAVSIPQEEFEASLAAFFQTSGRPENAGKVRSLFQRGLQQPDGFERDLGKRIVESANEG